MALNYTVIRMFFNFIIVLIPIIALFPNFNGKKLLYASKIPEAINLENIYCKNPQSYYKTDLHCSSMRQFFLTLKDNCVNKHYFKSKKHVKKIVPIVVLNENCAKNKRRIVYYERKEKANRSVSTVDLVVIGLLVISAGFSLVELYNEILRRRNQARAIGGGPGEIKPGDRRMSLIDLTVSRHARKRESQQLEMLRMNNKTIGVRPPPPLIRRMSFPGQLPEIPTIRGRHPPPMRQLSWCSASHRRLSFEMSEDDSSPDRRRVRLILRH